MDIKISGSKDCFTSGGKPFFYLADTAWSAFYSAELAEWEVYLNKRRSQDFNVIQISILPIIHDCSLPIRYYPFEMDSGGNWNFDAINEEYFDRAALMLKMAKEKGFKICLVLLWGIYVKGNWMSRNSNNRYVMNEKQAAGYIEYIAEKFKGLCSFYFVSGDINFAEKENNDSYTHALNKIKEKSPDTLCALHICGGLTEIPQEFIENNNLDFYVFQSGHIKKTQKEIASMAQRFCRLKKRPVLNAEPCYEGHGHGDEYGRFTARDVRNAFWQSVLGGAKAGFAYGAHGVWSWHRESSQFSNEKWSKTPFAWYDSLNLEGANDLGFMRWVYERYNGFAMEFSNDDLITDYDQITMAKSESSFIIFVPVPVSVKVRLNLAGYSVKIICLQSKRVLNPVINIENSISTVEMPELNEDYIIAGEQACVG